MKVNWVGKGDTVYDRVGGSEWFYQLLDFFYEDVIRRDEIRDLYPDDLTDSKKNTADFLIQYWGGPSRYSERRGHPRLRMRHAPYTIGEEQKESWLASMRFALDQMKPVKEVDEAMAEYFLMAADHMKNVV
ncbi:MAG: globin [Actinobacteria bacterium]|nr:globin [Actinomycetota bacterium]MAU39856.1 globin [Actinomycetota bacterium]|tara:strand:- start:48044 stop:48436 length:393 start_codon:yes stop_codon:yes gene_type:complete